LLADQSGITAAPFVFEGNAPADVRENLLLPRLLDTRLVEPATKPRIWLGAPNAIKGPAEAVFEKSSGSNLLIVGQRDEAVATMFALGLIALAAQHPPGTVRLVLLDGHASAPREHAFLHRVIDALRHDITVVKPADSMHVLKELAEGLQQDHEQQGSRVQRTFLFILGLQNFKKLKAADDFSFSMESSAETAPASAQLEKLITEGPSHGIHVIASADTYNNVTRWLPRKALSEFEMRVLFQMSANDSASLCDDPKASSLGLHRTLFYNEQQGYMELFRPYATPSTDWIEQTVEKLSRHHTEASIPASES
jgi:hypothetical protein